ncbi:group 1 truncated hemoglobin [Amaricoccus sp.]|uniref:group I truncated hemoglobin n=1 Tax=Amaricoccus sp. TaxID=1872485 RepID=UPI002628593B|nr:group 1 truncated hemoglobin [Amaricoccus sp.]HRO10605.1 group 1 truncated hemoglobin [Amaricoccus sp.]
MERILYEHLGGAAGISAIVDDLVEAHLRNPLIRHRFLPYLDRPDVVAAVKLHTRAFFGAASGGPERYEGRSMPDAHRGMNITDAEFAAAVEDIAATLERHAVDEGAREQVLVLANSLRSEIVNL